MKFFTFFTFSLNLRTKSGDGGSSATLVQFPVKLAHAVTAHKIQGASILAPATVTLNLNSTFEAAQAYVMLSRIQKIEQLFIYEKFDPKKIRVSQDALKELTRLKMISYNENPGIWREENTRIIKVAMLNCAGLKSHIQDIRNDDFLLKANVLQLVETSLENSSKTCNLEIDGYNSYFLNVSKGKGQAIYINEETAKLECNLVENGIQLSKFTISSLILITVYRSQHGNLGTLLDMLTSCFSDKDVVLITGDFNLCNKKKSNNAIKATLLTNGFKLLIEESTQIMGGCIDHAYWKDEDSLWDLPVLDRHSPYYSDHDALCISLKKK